MPQKKKLIIALASVVVVMVIGLTIKSNVLVKNNKVMEEAATNKSESTQSIESESDKSKSDEDAKSSASKKEKTTEGTPSSTGKDAVSSASMEEVANEGTTSSSTGQRDAVSSASASREEKIIETISASSNNTKDAVSSASKKEIATGTGAKNDEKNQGKTGGTSSSSTNSTKDAVSSASKNEKGNSSHSSENTSSQITTTSFIDKAINKQATKLIDLGWAKYIVVTFNQGNINDYNLYVLDNGNYKSISPSKVDDSGKIVKWEIDKLGYNTIKVKNKRTGEEGIYKFSK